MFSRYTIGLLPSDLERYFHVRVPGDYYPHFNAAPGQLLPLILNTRPMEITMGCWGFHSHFTTSSIKEESLTLPIGKVKVTEKWASSFQERRCLVLADGFYLWKKISSNKRIPFRVLTNSDNPICFAGTWQRLHHDHVSENRIEYMILTRKTYKPIDNISDHMPVVMSREQGLSWLKPDRSFEALIQTMETDRKSTRLNSSHYS